MSERNFFAELKRRNVYKVAVAYAVVAWLVIQVAATIVPALHLPAIITTAVVVLVLLGFPIALLLAWAFELTAQGITRTDTAVEAPAQRGGRAWMYVVAIGAALSVGLFFLGRYTAGPAGSASETADTKSIAVLPFVNASGDPTQEYFSDGLSEELINSLGQIEQLRVTGRSSSFRFKGQSEDARAVGQALGVANLLEGSVRKEGERVRISVSLVNTANGSQRWSESYNRELKDIFALQEEIAKSIAQKLRVTLLGNAVKATSEPSNQNLDAYNAFLRGEFHFGQLNVDNIQHAIESYKEAVRLDPNYARAHAGLAWAFCRLGWFGSVKGRDALLEARAAAQSALKLNPDLALAYAALAYVEINLDWDLAAAEPLLLRALQISPNESTIINTLANLRNYQDRPTEAVDLWHTALRHDPLNVTIQTNMAAVLTALGRLDEAEATTRKALELQPTSSRTHYLLARIHVLRGQLDAALREAQLEPGEVYRNMALAIAHAARRDGGAADEALRRMIEAHAEDNPFRIALVYAFRDEADKAFEWLDRAYTARDPRAINTAAEDLLKPYHSDPRFSAYCRKIGVPVPK